MPATADVSLYGLVTPVNVLSTVPQVVPRRTLKLVAVPLQAIELPVQPAVAVTPVGAAGIARRVAAAQELLALVPQVFTPTTQYWYAVPATAEVSL